MFKNFILLFFIFFCNSPCFAYYHGMFQSAGGYKGPPEYRLPLAVVSIILALGSPIGLAIWVNSGKKPTKNTNKNEDLKQQKKTTSSTENIDT